MDIDLTDHRLPRDLTSRLISAVRSGNDHAAATSAYALGIELEKIGLTNPGEAAILHAATDMVAGMRALDQRLAGADGVELIRGDSIVPEKIRWLWHKWLAAGKFHILGGAPGTGKTTVALSVAAAFSSGGNLPDNARAQASDCVIWTGEDGHADTLVPRLLAMGADLSRVHFVGPRIADGISSPFDPARDIGILTQSILRLGRKIKLLIVDPVVLVVPGDSHKNAETRRGLQPLVDLGAETGAAVLGITHFSKGTSGRAPLERITGSIAYAALGRVVWVAAKQAEEAGGGRVLAIAKSNLDGDDGGFAFDLENAELPNGMRASRVRWGNPIQGDAHEILCNAESSPDTQEREATADAGTWLLDVLRLGEVDAKTLRQLASDAGHAWRTVQRAGKKAGVRISRAGFGKETRTVWVL